MYIVLANIVLAEGSQWQLEVYMYAPENEIQHFQKGKKFQYNSPSWDKTLDLAMQSLYRTPHIMSLCTSSRNFIMLNLVYHNWEAAHLVI